MKYAASLAGQLVAPVTLAIRSALLVLGLSVRVPQTTVFATWIAPSDAPVIDAGAVEVFSGRVVGAVRRAGPANPDLP